MLIDKRVKKHIDGISDYEIYWFAIEMNHTTTSDIDVFNTPEHIRSEIINQLEFKNFPIDKADKILRHARKHRVIHINTVKWFYKRNEETLFLYMFFNHTKENIEQTNIESKIDVDLFTIELIYGNIISGDYDTGERIRKYAKMKSGNLKNIYNKIKTDPSSLKWLDKKNKKQIKWAYNYKSREIKSNGDIHFSSVLMLNSLFNINPDDTSLMYEYIIASLDFSVSIIFFDGEKIIHPDSKTVEDLKNKRLIFIHKMRNAWHKKVSQEKRKSTSTRFKLRSEALAQLKELAKKEKISQDKLLENIITEYYKDNRFKGSL